MIVCMAINPRLLTPNLFESHLRFLFFCNASRAALLPVAVSLLLL